MSRGCATREFLTPLVNIALTRFLTAVAVDVRIAASHTHDQCQLHQAKNAYVSILAHLQPRSKSTSASPASALSLLRCASSCKKCASPVRHAARSSFVPAPAGPQKTACACRSARSAAPQTCPSPLNQQNQQAYRYPYPRVCTLAWYVKPATICFAGACCTRLPLDGRCLATYSCYTEGSEYLPVFSFRELP
jgi:hypothetical protein